MHKPLPKTRHIFDQFGGRRIYEGLCWNLQSRAFGAWNFYVTLVYDEEQFWYLKENVFDAFQPGAKKCIASLLFAKFLFTINLKFFSIFIEKDFVYSLEGVHRYFCITLNGKGKILLTILLSLSQEEVRSISESVTWGLRKKLADGKSSVGYSAFSTTAKGSKPRHGSIR